MNFSQTKPSPFSEVKDILAKYREPKVSRSLWQLVTAVLPVFVLWYLMWVSLSYSYALTLLLAVPTAGLLLRIFMIQHDCGHGAFFKRTWANNIVGIFLPVFTMVPYHHWRKNHALHHATAGDLDNRGYGDIVTYTVDEYLKLSPGKRFFYRLYRHPLFLFGVAPLFHFVVQQRIPRAFSRSWKREQVSVYVTNLMLLTVALLLCWLVGFRAFFLIHFPVIAMAATAGVWLFYVQHQFDGTYWQHKEEWDYFNAGMLGSSYYKLPKVLQWFTANIGLHHIHHLDSRIPNYRLQECHDENPIFQKAKELTFFESFSCMSLRLWDEKRGSMISFRELKNMEWLSQEGS